MKMKASILKCILLKFFEEDPTINDIPFQPDNRKLDESIDLLCAEEVGDGALLEQELENDVECDESAKESNTKKGRGQNKDYEIIKQFESEKEFDTYWKEQNYEKEYNKY